MCREHGVLEALCTKCNRALVPVFQARGDWCAEHGFPESICPICHPERGGRPAVDVSVDDRAAPADGTKVSLASRDTAARAGIATERAAPPTSTSWLTVPARIAYDATRVARVNARASGVVRELLADVGSRVSSSSSLARIESADVGASQARARGAASRVATAEANVARVSSLRAQGLTSEREMLAARQELADARAEQAANRASLRVVGSGGGGGAGRYLVRAPIAGVVTRRGASIGMLVDTDDVLFEIVDTSSMWAELDVPEDGASLVREGAVVVVRVDGLAGRELRGTVGYVAPEVDPHTRTVRARVQLANPDGSLRANMLAEARIELAASHTGSWVPREAVQRARDAHLVFVRLGPDLYEARRVRIGAEADGRVQVEGRVAPGDEVATTGSFLLKTETLRESIGAGCCGED
ncbi:MAG: efflux RND transporter periplasmic adaptor subunit [Deltaproteobacteria bacterium]|nr:efflux RND transporter periplasmic adaptor subunit [Deltaproteobacteria bacterium]